MANDPVRLFDEEGDEQLRSLLFAARKERPRNAAMLSTLSALGVSAAALAATSSAAGAAGVASAGVASVGAGAQAAASLGSAKGLVSSAFLVAAKWVTVGAVAGAVATSAVYGVTSAPLPSPSASIVKAAPVAPRVLAVKPHSPPVAPAPEMSAEPESTPPPAVVAAPVSAPVVSAPPAAMNIPLAAEVAALDSARRALAAGDAARTLQLLNAYEQSFAVPHLLPEALYIRLEALTLQGDSAGKEAVARRILRAYPSGPHAARARAVLGLDK